MQKSCATAQSSRCPLMFFPKIFWGLNLNLCGGIIQKGPEFLLITPTKELNLFITKKKVRMRFANNQQANEIISC